jgi:YfiH family protein
VRQPTLRAVEPDFGSGEGLTWLTYPELAGSGLIHGILVFKDEPFTHDRDTWRKKAADVLRSSLEVSPQRVVIPTQIHSSRVRCISEMQEEQDIVCDGLVTDRPRVLLGVSIADCIPLFAVNLAARTVGIAHCGWKGIAAGIVEEFQSAVGRVAGRSHGTQYLIGASIGACCYEVGEDMLAHFSDEDRRDHVVKKKKGRCPLFPAVPFFHFDLKGLVASRLRRGGVQARQIYVDKTCTSCQKYVLCSYRADGGDCGRMLAFVMLTE